MDNLQKQIDNLKTLQESYDAVAQAAEAYNVGKVELARNITAKGVQASASETLPELAKKVGDIQQETINVTAPNWYGGQLSGDGVLWDLYAVLAQMKNQYLGAGHYSALIVCEYYKGYDSLQLQGADAYYTCDGVFYDYDANHVWNDAENGKTNRWVCFLYRDEGARLDITNTAISPRSMYIGGHIGTIEYFVNGRLTDLVCGVEDTDVVDTLKLSSYTQEWSRNVIWRNVGTIMDRILLGNANGSFVCDATTCTGVLQWNINSVNHISFPRLITFGDLRNISLYAVSAIEFRAPLLEKIQGVGNDSFLQYSGTNSYAMQLFYCPSLTHANCNIFTGSSIYGVPANLIDVWVGEMETNLRCNGWRPTNVLADATKTAQLIDNVKNHILARVSDRTGLSQLVFTVSTIMYNAIASEQIEWQGETMSLADAFLTKNWLLAGA